MLSRPHWLFRITGTWACKIIGDEQIYNPAEFSLTIPIAEHIDFFDGRSKRRAD